jgi:hypothetical protein
MSASSCRVSQKDRTRRERGKYNPPRGIHDVALFHDQVLDAVNLDLGARPFAEQHPVTDLDVHWNEIAILVAPTRSDSDDSALLWLSLAVSGIMMPPVVFLLSINAREHDSIVKRSEFHGRPPIS